MQYHYLINEGKVEGIADLYTDDAYVEFEGIIIARGRAEFSRAIPCLTRRLTFIKQFISNHMVDVTGDEATGISYLDARYVHDGKSVMATARFCENYRRTTGVWKISQMICHTYFNVPLDEGWAGTTRQRLVPLTEGEISGVGLRKADKPGD